MSYEKISLEYQGDSRKIAILKLNDPAALNAVGMQMLDELQSALQELRRSDCGCLLITGEGRGFCSGANLSDEQRNQERASQGLGDGLRSRYHPLLTGLRDLEMPIVTAVNGAAAGIGLSFALMGDMVCAARGAFFLQAFANIGLVPDGGSTFMLPRMVGWSRAVELSLLAERLPAEQALEWGLINRVFDDQALIAEAMAIAERLARGPRSLALLRKAFWNTWSNSYETQLDLEARLQDQAGQTHDYREGLQAFLEKRRPEFKGS